MAKGSTRLSSDIGTVILHWLLVFSLAISLTTGLRIASDDPSNSWYQIFDILLIQGEVIHWHVWAAFALFIITIGYSMYLLRARLTRRIKLNAHVLKGIRSDKHKIRWANLNRLLFWFGFTLIIIATVSGTLLYLSPLALPYLKVAFLHNLMAWGVIIYMVLHVLSQLTQGGIRQLLKILTPRMAYGVAATAAIVVSGAAATTVYFTDQLTISTLNINQITQPPKLDGKLDDAIWQTAERIAVKTVRGANHQEGEVTVYVRAVHDGEFIYSSFEWQDNTQSFKHLPMIKTNEGWKVVQTEFGIQDEDDYYEDKFGVMLSHSSRIAGGGSTHLGNKPLHNKPGPAGGRGLHYTTDDSIVDVWHWKSVRTGSDAMNQIDDNYFGAPLPPKSPGKRYTGGYTKDPKTAGGFAMNWAAYSDGLVKPKRLPRDPALLKKFEGVSLDPNTSDQTSLWLAFEDTVPYTEESDQYPVGTLLPAVLIKGPFEGDRGDVSSHSQWQDGWWRMEVKRKLDTGSKYDIAITPDRPVYLWVAAFDHAQTRHTQHLHPIRLQMN